MEWVKNQYNHQYDVWVPWLEDLYLRYFTRDNKASYTAKENLAKTKLTTNNPQLDSLQDNLHSLASSQLGQDGLARPVGDIVSSEGINRVERKGRDENGAYVPAVPGGESLPPVTAQGKFDVSGEGRGRNEKGWKG
ncbi:hypothetical protein N0V88_006019 [Collariella sp. IMI 366227]|nr:hypothetical protein N0V88_006019 [Collariella sp. IMI 366227]